MAYVTGDTILATHYNDFTTSVNAIWGTGSGDHGYGQSNTIASTSAGSTVTATQWSTLLARISSAATHQGSSISAISSPSAGETISAYSALSGNITTIDSARLNITSPNYTDTSDSGSAASSWTTSTVHEFTLTWGSGDEARYYFNAGGSTQFTFSRAGGTSHTKNSEWSNLATACGTIIFAAQGTTKSGGSGSADTVATTVGYHDMSTSNQLVFRQYEGDSPYTSNYIAVQAKSNGAQAGNGDSGSVLTFTITWADAAADNYDDSVDGTVTNTIGHRTPNTTALNNAAWTGAPTYSSTSFTQS
jgi:hypothetical protein